MKKIVTFLSVMLVGVFLLALTSAATDLFVVTKPNKANIRSLPALGESVLTKVDAGTRLRVLARNSATDINKVWLKVETPQGQVGWIAARITQYVKRRRAPEPELPASLQEYEVGTPLTTEPAPAAVPEPPAAPPSAVEPIETTPEFDIFADDEDLPEIKILEEEDEVESTP